MIWVEHWFLNPKSGCLQGFPKDRNVLKLTIEFYAARICSFVVSIEEYIGPICLANMCLCNLTLYGLFFPVRCQLYDPDCKFKVHCVLIQLSAWNSRRSQGLLFPKELRYHLAGEIRYTYLKRQVVLQDTYVIVPWEITVNRMLKEDCMDTVGLEPGIRAREECISTAKKRKIAKNSWGERARP